MSLHPHRFPLPSLCTELTNTHKSTCGHSLGNDPLCLSASSQFCNCRAMAPDLACADSEDLSPKSSTALSVDRSPASYGDKGHRRHTHHMMTRVTDVTHII